MLIHFGENVERAFKKILIAIGAFAALCFAPTAAFADAGFGRLEIVGPGNTVYRGTALEPGSSTQFVSVGRSWVGTQYQAIVGGYLKASGREDVALATNANLNGKILRDFEVSGYDNLCNSVVASTTHYFTACRSMTSTGYYDIRIMKFNRNGTLDATFGTGGVVSTALGGTAVKGHAFVRGIAWDANNSRVIIAGAIGFYTPGVFHPFVAGYEGSNGAFVNSNTVARIDGTATAVAVGGSTNYYVTSTETSGSNHFFVHRFTTAFAESASPWGDVIDMTQAGGGTDSIPTSLAVFSTYVVAVGATRINDTTPPWNCAAVAVRTSTSPGTLDPGFGSVTITGGTNLKGITIFSHNGGTTPTQDCILNTVEPPPSGTNIIMVGTVYNGTNYDPVAAKISSAGALVNGFGTNGISSSSALGSYDEVLNAMSYFADTSYVYAVGRGGDGTYTGALTTKIDITTGVFSSSPQINSISPTVGSSAGGTPVTILGSGFVNSVTSVALGGVSCGSFSFISSTEVRCTTGAHAAGQVDVVVTVNSSTGTATNAFTYLPTLTLSAVAPTSGTTLGGTAIVLTGTNFDRAATVTVGGVTCTNPFVTGTTDLTCSTGAHAAGAVNVVITNPDGTTATLTNAFTYVSPPTVTSVTPTFGAIAGGGTVTINGTGFVTGATIDFGGVTCGSASFSSAILYTCTLPAHGAGPVTVKVTNADGAEGHLDNAFTYWGAPTVANITPSGGSTAGGTVVVIRGTNYHSAATVAIDGVNCGTLTVDSRTQITCTTGAHAAGAVNVVVTSVGQTGTLTSGYTYRAAPTITADVSPATGILNGGTPVTLTGTGFVSGATVDFGGSACAGVNVASSTSITCTTTAHAVGAVTVTVTNSDGQNGNRATAYTYTAAAPVVTAITPIAGNTLGDTPVTITGTGFIAGATAALGGSNCASLVIVSLTRLTCLTTSHAAGLVSVAVTTSGGTGTLSNSYTYQPAPTISSVAPTLGNSQITTPITITGTGFLAGVSVTVGGSICNGVNLISSTQIGCVTPAKAAGTYDIIVTNADGQSVTLGSAFTYRDPPTVSSVSPASGVVGGGTPVTITGTGFLAGATASFGGSSCGSLVVASVTSITCTTSSHAAGAVTVTVTNSDTFAGTKASAFTYTAAAPTVTSIAPAAGPLAGGTVVTIRGTAFEAGSTVSIGGVSCGTLVVDSATQIHCTTGAHAAGAVNVVVTTTGGTGTLTNGFTYQSAPLITSVSPNLGTSLGGQNITIRGSNFNAGATVSVGGVNCGSIQFYGSTLLTCDTGAHAAGTVNVVVTNTDLQSATAVGAYQYVDTPVVSTVSPSSGTVHGGTAITITGLNFHTNPYVEIGPGRYCDSIVFVSSTSITCTVPPFNAGAVTVTVTNRDDGYGGEKLNGYTYTAATPIVTSITPNVGTTSGGTATSIFGTGFESNATASIGGVACLSTTYLFYGMLLCTAPSSASEGAVNVSVTTTPGTGTLTNGFTFQFPPRLFSISPSGGSTAGGTPITLTGSGYRSGATVSIGGTACTSVVVVTSTSITCTTGAKAAGMYTVLVTNTSGISGSLYNGYTYALVPTIRTVAPSSGPVAGGTPVTVTGTNFQSTDTVKFNGVNCTSLVYVNSTQFTCVTPASSTNGTVEVRATHTDGAYGVRNAFTYLGPGDWLTITTTGAPTGRGMHAAVWTGSRMLIWGGRNGAGSDQPTVMLNSGGIYNPVTDSWTAMSSTNAPQARIQPNAVWTGTKMIIWGGRIAFWQGTSTGGVYDFASNTWTPTGTGANVHPAGVDATGVWTGSKMLIWGGVDTYGYGGISTNAGSLYDPTTAQWTRISTTTAPAARYGQAGVWTGTQLLIWGGNYIVTGGVYTLATNTWTVMSSTGQPTPGATIAPKAVWGGARMLVYARNLNSFTVGKYNPVTNTWASMSTTNAPVHWTDNTIVWTGSKMAVWGGTFGNGAATGYSGGAYYDPATDAWTAITTYGGPLARSFHTSVVGAGYLLIYGGQSAYNLNGDCSGWCAGGGRLKL